MDAAEAASAQGALDDKIAELVMSSRSAYERGGNNGGVIKADIVTSAALRCPLCGYRAPEVEKTAS
jgi:hypothetical protein